MVQVVVVGAGPEGDDVAQAPGEVITRVGVDGLEQTQDDPQVHGDEVQVARDADPDDGAADDAEAQEHDLDWGGVLSSQAEGGAVRVVQLVDRLVQRAVVQSAVEPVVPGILHDEEGEDLVGHLPPRREREAVLQAEEGGDGVEEPDLRQLDGAVADEDKESAVPLLLPSGKLGLLRGSLDICFVFHGEEELGTNILDLPLVEERNGIDDDPWEGPAEIDELVHDEAHDARRDRVILHPEVPRLERTQC